MRYEICGVILAVLSVAPLPCHAQAAPSEASGHPQARRWYGWQTFTTDGVAAGLFVGAAAADQNTSLYGSSALVFGLGAPMVHLAHGHWEYALCSLGLRVAMPLFGAIIGGASDVKSHDDGAAGGDSAKWATVGVAVGGVAASLIDGFALAYDQEPAPTAKPERNQLLKLEPY